MLSSLPAWRDVRKLMGQGLPITFTVLSDLLMSLGLSIVAGLVSVDAQAALSYPLRLQYIFWILLDALGQTGQHEIGRIKGPEQKRAVSAMAKHSLYTSLLYLVPPCLVAATYPAILNDVFGDCDKGCRQTMAVIVPIMAAGFIATTVQFSTLTALGALDDNKKAHAIVIACSLLSLGAVIFLVLNQGYGAEGIAAGYTAGAAVGAVALFPRWCSRIAASLSRSTFCC